MFSTYRLQPLPPRTEMQHEAAEALKEFATAPMVPFGPRTALRHTVEAATSELGISPRIAFETNQPLIMESLITRGLAWSIVPELLAESWRTTMSVWGLPIRTVRQIGLTWSVSGGLQPAAISFRDYLRQAV